MYKVRIDYDDYLCPPPHIDAFLSMLKHVKKVDSQGNISNISYTVEVAPDYERIAEKKRLKDEVCGELVSEKEQYKKWWLDSTSAVQKLQNDLKELKDKYGA